MTTPARRAGTALALASLTVAVSLMFAETHLANARPSRPGSAGAAYNCAFPTAAQVSALARQVEVVLKGVILGPMEPLEPNPWSLLRVTEVLAGSSDVTVGSHVPIVEPFNIPEGTATIMFLLRSDQSPDPPLFFPVLSFPAGLLATEGRFDIREGRAFMTCRGGRVTKGPQGQPVGVLIANISAAS